MIRATLQICACLCATLPLQGIADSIFVFQKHTYKIVSTPSSWATASAAASKMRVGQHQGYLARVDSARENRVILEALSAHLSDEQLAGTLANDGSEAPFAWLGGSDSASEGQWVWENNGDVFWSGDFNGRPIGGRYNNWGMQPDGASGDEDALAIGLADWPDPFYDLGSAGQWNDLDGNNRLVYVVEFDGKSDLRVAVEEPVAGGVHSGVGLIRGWAVSSNPIERIEVFVNDEYRFDIPYGGMRGDVGLFYPDIPNSDKSGYATAVNFSALDKGEHTLTVRVRDSFGSVVTRTTRFEATRFDKSFLDQSDTVDLDWSRVTGMGDTLSVREALIDGEYYNITLQWRTSSQSFEIVSIDKK